MYQMLDKEEADRRIKRKSYGKRAPPTSDGERDGDEDGGLRAEQPELEGQLTPPSFHPRCFDKGEGRGGGDQGPPTPAMTCFEPANGEQGKAVSRPKQPLQRARPRHRLEANGC